MAPCLWNDNKSINKKPIEGRNLVLQYIQCIRQDDMAWYLDLGILGVYRRQRVKLQLKGLADERWKQ